MRTQMSQKPGSEDAMRTQMSQKADSTVTMRTQMSQKPGSEDAMRTNKCHSELAVRTQSDVGSATLRTPLRVTRRMLSDWTN